jgi:hypothetical protein
MPACVWPGRIETIRILKDCRIPICTAPHQLHYRAARHGNTTDLRVARGPAEQALNWRVQPQNFLGKIRDEGRICPQLLFEMADIAAVNSRTLRVADEKPL